MTALKRNKMEILDRCGFPADSDSPNIQREELVQMGGLTSLGAPGQEGPRDKKD